MGKKLKPCRKCGSKNLEKKDCGYTTFNVAWVKCLNCEHEVKRDCCDDATYYWNRDSPSPSERIDMIKKLFPDIDDIMIYINNFNNDMDKNITPKIVNVLDNIKNSVERKR